MSQEYFEGSFVLSLVSQTVIITNLFYRPLLIDKNTGASRGRGLAPGEQGARARPGPRTQSPQCPVSAFSPGEPVLLSGQAFAQVQLPLWLP